MKVETPFGKQEDCWIARGALTQAQVSRLSVSVQQLNDAVSFGLPPTPHEPKTRIVTPGRTGGTGAAEMAPNSTHMTRYLERLDIDDNDSPLAHIQHLAQVAGVRLIKMPFEVTTFTKPGSVPTPGVVGHADTEGGFVSAQLVNDKDYDLQLTGVRHPFGD